jgi:diketogulonate reductase-like aldo/keto reductase
MAMNALILDNGVEMPWIGMGTYPLNGLKLALLVRKAVQLGYRSFDSASAYGNETWLGRGLRFCGVERTQLFVTTKLSNGEQRVGNVKQALHNSLKRLGFKYADLYLMHWPNPDTYVNCWKEMEQLYRDGLVRAIGVCNFHAHHLVRLLESASIVPSVNQVELHPLLSQAKLVAFCREKGIRIQAYSPLARLHAKLIGNKEIVSIAGQHHKTVSQIILRWNYQHQVAPVPKSGSPLRLRENISIGDFALSEMDMNTLDRLNINFRVRHDPDTCDFTKL